MRIILTLILAFCFFRPLAAQVQYNHASDPQIMNNSNDLSLTKLVSSKIPLFKADIQKGEYIPFGFQVQSLDQSSIWIVFHIGTVRDVSIEILQNDTAIPLNAVGFQTYKLEGAIGLPKSTELEQSLPALNHFGKVRNTCLAPGTYMIQVLGSSKATDSVWVEININQPSAPACDNHLTAALLPPGQTIFNTECISLSTAEKELIENADSFKAAWFKVILSPTRLKSLILFNYGYGRCIVYKKIPNSNGGSFEQLVPGYIQNLAVNSAIYYDYGSGPDSPDTLYVGIFVEAWLSRNLYLNFYEYFKSPQDYPASASGKYFNFKTISSSTSNIYAESIDYNNLYSDPCTDAKSLKINACQIYTLSDGSKDTICNPDSFYYNSWAAFTINERNRISFNRGTYLRVFKYETGGTCSFTEVFNNNYGAYSACLEKGNYFIQYCFKKPKNRFPDVEFYTEFGSNIDFRIYASTGYIKAPIKFNQPATAEKVIIPAGPGNSRSGAIAGFNPNSDTTYVIDSISLKGQFQFREIYLTEPSNLSISEFGGHYSDLALFYGKASQNLAGLKRVKDYFLNNGTIPYMKTSYLNPISQCKELPAGWYTLIIVSNKKYEGKDECDLEHFKNEALPMYNVAARSKSNNHQYNKPGLINNGNPLTLGALAGFNGQGSRQVSYGVADDYFACNPPDIIRDSLLKRILKTSSKYSTLYYRFTLKDSGEIKIQNNTAFKVSSILLFNGIVDLNNYNNYNNWTKPCSDGIEFCTLPPGTYTLMMFGFPQTICSFKIYYDHVREYPYDDTKGAMDLGSFNKTKSVISDPLLFNCKSEKTTEEPYVSPLYYSICGEEPFRAASVQRLKTLWATFTLDNPGTIDIEPVSFKNEDNIVLYLYEIDDDPTLPLGDYKPTSNINSKLVQYGNKISFKRVSCDKRRYFVMAGHQHYNSYSNPVIYLKTTFTIDVSSKQYFNCSEANELNVYGVNSWEISNPLRCLDPYKMKKVGDEFLDSNWKYKSTWYKINFTSSSPLDLEFYLKGLNLTSYAYRVMMGECEALTTVATASSGTSSFRINCLGPGTYFVQVFVPIDESGNISLGLKSTPTAHGICKPLPTTVPFANFLYSGSCASDTLNFQNYSTSGSSISFNWYYDGKHFSTKRDPLLPYSTLKTVDSILVKLVVTHIPSGAKDSVVKKVFKYPDSYFIRLNGPDTATCSIPFKLNAETNFPFAYELTSPDLVFDSSLTSHPIALSYPTNFSILLKSGSCQLKHEKSIEVKRIPRLFKDTAICASQYLKIQIPDSLSKFHFYLINTERSLSKNDSLPVGVWYISINNWSCQYLDTITITGIKFDSGLPSDTVTCDQSSITVNALSGADSYLWENGSDNPSRILYTAGKYTLKTFYKGCQDIQNIQFHQPKNTSVLDDDTTICFNQVLSVQLPWSKVIWNDGNKETSRLIDKPGLWTAFTDSLGCTYSDSIRLYMKSKSVNTLRDTSLCPGDIMKLSTKVIDPTWLPDEIKDKDFIIKEAGIYGLKWIDPLQCNQLDSFKVYEVCEPYLFIPNSFSPNGNFTNDSFAISALYIKDYHIRIFNRWGELVFESNSLNIAWDGTINNTNATEGVYFYSLEYRSEKTGRSYFKSGNITMLR